VDTAGGLEATNERLQAFFTAEMARAPERY
jgi:hypothetical protein